MNEDLKTGLWVIFWISLIFVILSILIYTMTLDRKYGCEDLESLGIEVNYDLRWGVLFIPYNHCAVLVEDEYYSLYKYKQMGVDKCN